MRSTFNNLIAHQELQQAEGDPFTVIPIKNAKRAFECIEVHLAGRKIEKLVRFDKFPNLEVLWINDNKLQNVTGLEANFRIKHLYAQDNRLTTLKGSISVMQHLEHLSVYNNELRGLDDVIEFLSGFTYLRHLDLFGNPLAEEPFYKDRVIHGIPQLQIIDRHQIGYHERVKAKQVTLKYSNSRKKKRRKKNQKTIKKEFRVSECFSKGEKNLYKDAERVEQTILAETYAKEMAETRAREELFTQDYDMNEPPISYFLQVTSKNRAYANRNKRTQFNFREIKLMQDLFLKYDTANKRQIDKDGFKAVFASLVSDEIGLGKVPTTTLDEALESFNELRGPEENEKEEGVTYKNESGKISRLDFEEICFSLKVRRRPQQELKKQIEELYKQSLKTRKLGNREKADKQLLKAIWLDNVNSELYGTKSFQLKETYKAPNRTDYFNFGKYQFKDQCPYDKREIL